MSGLTLKQIKPENQQDYNQLETLLHQEGIALDAHLSYTVGLFEGEILVATGSYFASTLRCLAVAASEQGKGYMNQIVTHLTDALYREGVYHVFLITKPEYQRLFEDLGFYTLVKVPELLIFMENKPKGLSEFLDRLRKDSPKERDPSAVIGALVMNANPFTLGHQYLVEKASETADWVHLFVVEADESVFSFEDRYNMIVQGVSHLKNVIVHASGPYMISMATFPSYFLKEPTAVLTAHARLDLTLFTDYFAKALDISIRFVGDEPLCETTRTYVDLMTQLLPEKNIVCQVIPRKMNMTNHVPISASRIRELIRSNLWSELQDDVPLTTYEYLIQMEASGRLETVKKSNTRH